MSNQSDNKNGKLYATIFIGTSDDDTDRYIICPFCYYFKIDPYNHNSLVDMDYGNRAMIWCEQCNVTAFLDYFVDDYNRESKDNNIDPERKIPDKYYIGKKKLNVADTPEKYTTVICEYLEYKVPLLKILRVTGSKIIHVKNKLTDDEIRDVYNKSEYTKDNELVIPREIEEKYQIIEEDSTNNNNNDTDNDNDNDNNDITIDPTDNVVYTQKLIRKKQLLENKILSIPVNSYNLMKPEIPYPKNFNLDHDGITIYLLLENNMFAFLSGD